MAVVEEAVPVAVDKSISPFNHALTTIKYVRERTDKVILFYSGGKDSLVLLDLLSLFSFKEIHCVFMYFIQGLEHQKPLLKYPEKYNNTHIHQFPHWMVSHYIRHAHYQFHRTSDKKVPLLKLTDIEEYARRKTGVKWIVNGAKKSDSLHRNLMCANLKFDSINEKSSRVYPLALWKKAEVMAYIKNKDIIQPTEYGISKSNGVDLKLDVLLFLREKFPADYQKIIHHFPFAEKIIFDYEYNQKHGETSKVSGQNNKPKGNKKRAVQSA